MQMLTKFESKSSRAKGVCFHPVRPWVLVSLHSSTIQLWDYRMGTLIDRFEDHEGPVRGVDFHPTQPLFVSCGDDYTVKVWSLQSRKCIFTLTGHLDYVRTCFFHSELPWIISASDDQTIRIWNWQNRQEIACLTGHNHYVMCAQFHPSEPLVVSASLDQTVRVWDISGLQKKHSAPAGRGPPGGMSFEDQMARSAAAQQDIFGNTDAIVKYVLEGHDRGVNWAAFHPRLPLIVSGGDDRVLKLWRMADTKAWEVDTCRGHTNNVSACLFHPHQDLILSAGEDRTIRVWDLNSRLLVQTFKRETDRFWLVAAHRVHNLFAACHDGGVVIFKLARERPAAALHHTTLLYVNRDREVRAYDLATESESLPLLSLKQTGSPWVPLRTLSYNPAERSVLVTGRSAAGAGMYELAALPRDAAGAVEPQSSFSGTGDAALFVARNRFAVLNKETSTLEVRDLTNSTTKTIKLDQQVTEMCPGGTAGCVLLLGPTTVTLYDVQQRKPLAEAVVANVKYVCWAPDGQHVALLGKHSVTVADKELKIVCASFETLRVKSAAWDDSGVLFYSTLNHIKYTLLNGDSGIIKTLENTLYLVKVKDNKVICLTREGTVEVVPIEPAEYRFKQALSAKNYADVLRIIRGSTLVGQNIVAYLEQKGYPEIALQFVQDSGTRFELGLECGNLSVALEEAQALDAPVTWERLGQAALQQGNFTIVELAYQKLHEFDKLAFLYLASGNIAKLEKMQHIAEYRGDYSAVMQTALFLGNTEKQVELLRAAGLFPLAYAAARAAGREDLAQEVLEDADMTAEEAEAKIPAGKLPAAQKVPQPVVPTAGLNWPVKDAGASQFELAVLGQIDALTVEDSTETEKTVPTTGVEADLFAGEDVEADGDGWDLEDDDLDVGDELDKAVGTSASDLPPDVPGTPETELWLRNAKCAAGHVAAGSFQTAATMLNRQVGVVNFEPLRERFMEVYAASKLWISGHEGTEPLPMFLRAEFARTSSGATEVQPFVPGLESLETTLHAAFKLFNSNKLEEAVAAFRKIIYTVCVLAVPTPEDEEKCREVLSVCREYILGLSIELKRRSLPEDAVVENLTLAAYFTRANLQPAHLINALYIAMNQSFKHKNYASASYFAAKFLDIVATGKKAETARKVKVKSDKIGRDEIEIDFDRFAEFDVCAATFTPIYKGSPFVTEALTGAKYKPEQKGKLCKITGITEIGASVSGLRLLQ